MLLLFSHTLTEDQKKDARQSLGISEFLALPQALQEIWSRVPASGELASQIVKTFTDWIQDNSQPNDCVLVQGDFGLTFAVTAWCLKNKIQAVYSTTQRAARENKLETGSIEIVHTFKHVTFRKYRFYGEK